MKKKQLLSTVLLLLTSACSAPVPAPLWQGGGQVLPAYQVDSPHASQAVEAVLIGAGDIGRCGAGVEQTAALLKQFPDAVIFTAGDNAYEDGTAADFQKCFDPSWGRYKSRIHPAAGNHDYHTGNAGAYFNYFGAAAGDPAKGYYSYNLGSWHIIVLNSNCKGIGGCEEGSPQEAWLKEDLAANPSRCSLAYWHHPFYSSGEHGSNQKMHDLWRDVSAAGVELVISGHDHDYERFAPQNADGSLDLKHGVRQFVIGTGGASFYTVTRSLPNSEKIISGSYGLLKLTLQKEEYRWEFLPVGNGPAMDKGSEACHE